MGARLNIRSHGNLNFINGSWRVIFGNRVGFSIIYRMSSRSTKNFDGRDPNIFPTSNTLVVNLEGAAKASCSENAILSVDWLPLHIFHVYRLQQ